MEEKENYFNLDYINNLDNSDYISYFQYVFIFKLRNLQVLLNNNNNEKETIKNFININELDYFFEFLKALQIKNLKEIELFFDCIRENYKLMIKQKDDAENLNLFIGTYAHIKGNYYPNYKEMKLVFKSNDCFYKKTENLTNLIDYIVKPIW